MRVTTGEDDREEEDEDENKDEEDEKKKKEGRFEANNSDTKVDAEDGPGCAAVLPDLEGVNGVLGCRVRAGTKVVAGWKQREKRSINKTT